MPLTAAHGRLAVAAAKSTNAKIGDAASTYAAQASCPSSCAFFNGGGCYAENGLLYSGVTKPLNEAAASVSATSLEVAKAEAAAIDRLPVFACYDRPLRLHTVGDCRTDEAARIVSAAAERYMERGGGAVWTYTHAWQVVDRESWGKVSVLASCETPAQVELARARGYAPSIVVERFPQRTKYVHSGELEVLPCPAQTRDDVTCSSCQLCFNDQGIMDRGYAIGFAVHGTAFTIKKATQTLRAPSDTGRRLTSRDLIPHYLQEHPAATTGEIAHALDLTWGTVADMRRRLAEEAAA